MVWHSRIIESISLNTPLALKKRSSFTWREGQKPYFCLLEMCRTSLSRTSTLSAAVHLHFITTLNWNPLVTATLSHWRKLDLLRHGKGIVEVIRCTIEANKEFSTECRQLQHITVGSDKDSLPLMLAYLLKWHDNECCVACKLQCRAYLQLGISQGVAEQLLYFGTDIYGRCTPSIASALASLCASAVCQTSNQIDRKNLQVKAISVRPESKLPWNFTQGPQIQTEAESDFKRSYVPKRQSCNSLVSLQTAEYPEETFSSSRHALQYLTLSLSECKMQLAWDPACRHFLNILFLLAWEA